MPAASRTLIASILGALLLAPSAASAHGPTECTSGPTRLASADAPAIVDAHGDTSVPYGVPYGPAGDLIGGWVTGPSAWEDGASTEKFVAHMRVEALDRPPVLARYYFIFSGAGGEHWVRAVFSAPDSWTFAYGTYADNFFTQNGTTTGSVNTSAGTISIDLPKETLPTRPADGKALDLNLTAARSYLRHEPLPTGGNLRLVDEALGGDCAVTLYEAAPVAP
jgi:hypothetical protein